MKKWLNQLINYFKFIQHIFTCHHYDNMDQILLICSIFL
jgi:hypothetical protein